MKYFLSENAKILASSESSYVSEAEEIRAILEDANSPITRKYQEKLYKSVLSKAHIDFDDIPKSAGNIRNYSGYPTMTETLNTIYKLAAENKATTVMEYCTIVQEAIKNIEDLSATYNRGFVSKCNYVAMEYDSYVYFCVEATTALLYSFVEVIKDPHKDVMDMRIKNDNLRSRADGFFFIQLQKFNKVQKEMGINYRKMLENMCDKGKDNFIGLAEVVGFTAISAAALAIVPITREVIYQIYNFRGKISNSIELQATFLELNKASVESNDLLTVDKKKAILNKQEKLAKKLHSIASTLKVQTAKSIIDSKRDLSKDNSMLSIDNLRDEVSNAPFEIL